MGKNGKKMKDILTGVGLLNGSRPNRMGKKGVEVIREEMLKQNLKKVKYRHVRLSHFQLSRWNALQSSRQRTWC